MELNAIQNTKSLELASILLHKEEERSKLLLSHTRKLNNLEANNVEIKSLLTKPVPSDLSGLLNDARLRKLSGSGSATLLNGEGK